jgi:hypothetical protein
LVDTVGGDLGWSLGVVRVSRSFSALPVTQARIKGILILFITYVWFSLNHIQDSFGVLDENFRIYTLATPIKSLQDGHQLMFRNMVTVVNEIFK